MLKHSHVKCRLILIRVITQVIGWLWLRVCGHLYSKGLVIADDESADVLDNDS